MGRLEERVVRRREEGQHHHTVVGAAERLVGVVARAVERAREAPARVQLLLDLGGPVPVEPLGPRGRHDDRV